MSRTAPVARMATIVLICALNLRTVLAAIGAGASEVERELGAGGAATGTVSTVSVLLIATGSPVALRLDRRLGLRHVVTSGLGLTIVAYALLLVPGTWSIWFTVAAGGLGAGLLGTVLPAVVRALSPRHVGVGIAMFMLGSSGGFYIASVAVPATLARGFSWRCTGIPLGALAIVSALVWWLSPTARTAGQGARSEIATPALISALRAPWVRLLTAYLALQSAVLFAQIAWLVPTLTSQGVPAGRAGALLGAFSAFQLVTGIAMPLLAQRLGHIGRLCAGAGGAIGLGVLAILMLPGLGADTSGGMGTWMAVTVLGLGHGGSFALANFAIAAVAPTPQAAVSAGATIMLVSQGAGALGPLAFGAMRDISRGYDGPWIMMLAPAAALIVLGLLFDRTLKRRGDTSPSHGNASSRPA